MKTVLIKTYVAHRMRAAYNAMSPENHASIKIGNSWIHKDEDTNEQVTISPTAFSWVARYEGTYGNWKGEYDQDDKGRIIVKNVKPTSPTARSYDELKHTVTIN